MPEALGRGGADTAKAVLGMMHEPQEPDPACPAASRAGSPSQQSGEERVVTGEAVSSLCCQSQAPGWPVSLFCSSHTMRSYKKVMLTP